MKNDSRSLAGVGGWIVVPFTETEKYKEGAGLEREVQEFDFGCNTI